MGKSAQVFILFVFMVSYLFFAAGAQVGAPTIGIFDPPKVERFRDLKKFINRNISRRDGKILLIWDVDNVLVVKNELADDVRREVYRTSPNASRADLCSIVDRELPPVLSARGFPKLISGFRRNKKIATIALTSSKVGWSNRGQPYAEHRVANLKANGIDFSFAFPQIRPTILDMVYDPVSRTTAFGKYDYNRLNREKFEGSNSAALYMKGVLFTDRKPKGSVLSRFLVYLKYVCGYVPDKVIMIDDSKTNLQDVRDWILEFNRAYESSIDYVCARYIRERKRRRKVSSFARLIRKHRSLKSIRKQGSVWPAGVLNERNERRGSEHGACCECCACCSCCFW